MNKFATDTLLLPVIGESPAGDDIEYDPVYSEIRQQGKMILTTCPRENGLSVNLVGLTGEVINLCE